MRTLNELEQIESQLAAGPLPKASRQWGGADVVISTKPSRTPATNEHFYSEPRYVISEHALQLSWLFEVLRDAFYSDNRLDSQTKIEFFGRLANAANRCLKKVDSPTDRELCAAVLHEAFAIAEEMDDGTFDSLPVAVGNEIVDDHVDEALRTGFIGIENTRNFFLERGVDLETT